ncbi:MAG: acyl-CoA dehydrogenase family protein [Chloroflexi bacterium]|nr:acyl-CoA dehydrogenase family protein [Chloroflexota bacterium]
MVMELTEQQKMLKKTVHDFATKEIAPIAAAIDKSGEFPHDCVSKMSRMGLSGLLVPPAFGGTGPDRLGFFIALEEVAAASAGLAVSLLMSSLVASSILALGNDKQKAKYLPGLAAGKQLGALAATEPSGGANYPFTLQSTARLDGGSYVLNGTKCFISNGSEAGIYLVLARTDLQKGPMGISGLIVEKGTPGFSFGKKDEKLGLRCDVTCELIFEDCRVPRADLLAEGILMPLGAKLATLAMPALGAIATGIARAALEAATGYVKQRVVVAGQTLAGFDNVQYAIADMLTHVEASRLMVHQAGSMPDGETDMTPALAAGIFPCEAALEVANKALQVFGTYGYTSDFAPERYFRDARGLVLIAQPVELRKLFMARMKLGLPPMAPPGGMPPRPAGA